MLLPRRTLTVLATVVLLLPALSSCSRHTALTVQADLVPFLGASGTQASVPYNAGTVTLDLPPNTTNPTAGALVDLTSLGVPTSASAAIDALALELDASLTPSSAIGAGTATLYIADASANDVFQAQYQVASIATPALSANQTGDVHAAFQLDAQTDASALALIQSGSFRIGVEVRGSAAASGTLQLDVTKLLVSVSLPPGYGLP